MIGRITQFIVNIKTLKMFFLLLKNSRPLNYIQMVFYGRRAVGIVFTRSMNAPETEDFSTGGRTTARVSVNMHVLANKYPSPATSGHGVGWLCCQSITTITFDHRFLRGHVCPLIHVKRFFPITFLSPDYWTTILQRDIEHFIVPQTTS